jgi:hypothetical protein
LDTRLDGFQGGLEHAKAISLASFSPSKIRRHGRRCALLSAQHRLKAFFRQSPAHPVDHRSLVSSASIILLSLHPSPASETSALSKIRALATGSPGLSLFE